jgi:hypothetical protein
MKILCSDYDGTFNYQGVTAELRENVAHWRREGNLFGFVTGRSLDTILKICADDGVVCDFLVCNNGAYVCRFDRTVLFESHCSIEYARPLLDRLFEWGCSFVGITYSNVAYSIQKEPSALESGDWKTEKWVCENLPYFTQINTVFPTFERSKEVCQKIVREFGEILTPLQNGICIDIVPIGVNKAQGIRHLIDSFQAKESDVITVGDNINDEAMIAQFRSYAVQNAVPSILKLADAVVKDVSDLIQQELE